MAPLLLLFLLGGLFAALFSLTSSSRATNKRVVVAEEHHVDEKEHHVDEKERHVDEKEEGDLGLVFSTFDHDGDGFITAAEVEESLNRLGIAVSSPSSSSSADGLIDINEFRDLYESIPRKEEDMREAFEVFDGNKDGLISADELSTVLDSLGLRRSTGDVECRDMIRLVDVDGDGMVNFDEFKRMMRTVGNVKP